GRRDRHRTLPPRPRRAARDRPLPHRRPPPHLLAGGHGEPPLADGAHGGVRAGAHDGRHRQRARPAPRVRAAPVCGQPHRNAEPSGLAGRGARRDRRAGVGARRPAGGRRRLRRRGRPLRGRVPRQPLHHRRAAGGGDRPQPQPQRRHAAARRPGRRRPRRAAAHDARPRPLPRLPGNAHRAGHAARKRRGARRRRHGHRGDLAVAHHHRRPAGPRRRHHHGRAPRRRPRRRAAARGDRPGVPARVRRAHHLDHGPHRAGAGRALHHPRPRRRAVPVPRRGGASAGAAGGDPSRSGAGKQPARALHRDPGPDVARDPSPLRPGFHGGPCGGGGEAGARPVAADAFRRRARRAMDRPRHAGGDALRAVHRRHQPSLGRGHEARGPGVGLRGAGRRRGAHPVAV
ncbi:MAG: Acetylornithine deacetylase/Succinyl-diaminopimelate desuccinylase and related deacylases, partial [uncultured Acetobacteraceae bacterium]